MSSRIYVVVDKQRLLEEPRLVRAGHPSAAIKHVAGDRLSAEVATQDTLVDLIGRGAKVEEATPRDPHQIDALDTSGVDIKGS